jgi:hypothetical protein
MTALASDGERAREWCQIRAICVPPPAFGSASVMHAESAAICPFADDLAVRCVSHFA